MATRNPPRDPQGFASEEKEAGDANTSFGPRPSIHPWPVARGARGPPSYRTAVQHAVVNEAEFDIPQSDDDPPPWMRAPPTSSAQDVARGTWPPSAVIKEDRAKATAVWTILLLGFIAYVVYLATHSLESRENPPVQIQRKEEPFKLPDVVFCPGPGDGCDSNNGTDCLPMSWRLSALEGFANCDKYFATPSPVMPTPSPSPAPTMAPTMVPTPAPSLVPTPSPSLAPTAVPNSDTPVPIARAPPSPGTSSAPYATSSPYETSSQSEPTEVPETPVPTPTATTPPTPSPNTPSTPSPTGAPVMLPAIRVSLETTAHEWCPRVPLSECDIDHSGIDSGGVRSLHASFYEVSVSQKTGVALHGRSGRQWWDNSTAPTYLQQVLWDDTVSSEPVSSARRFINLFFVDQDAAVTDAVVAVRLPYDRVNINGTDPFTFSSNDVILSMSQYVHLDSDGKSGATERTFTQATTTAQHTLRLDTFEGEAYEGALLYVTLSVNNFAYQSVEEVDPVDVWALLGSAGGMWEIVCVAFGACFVAREVSGPDKKWGWKKKKDRKKEDWEKKRSKYTGRWHSDVVGGPIPAVAARPSAATSGGTLTEDSRL